jgi:hypothetical protein
MKRFSDKKTWKFSAKNVRDFGIATSRKFIYDAMAVKLMKRGNFSLSKEVILFGKLQQEQ